MGADKEVTFLANSILDSRFVSRAPSVVEISRLVTGLVTVNGNNEGGRSNFFCWAGEDSALYG